MSTTSPVNSQPSLQQGRMRFNFNAKYGELGGVDKLMEMAANHGRVEEMGKYFGLTNSRISQILEVLIGTPYSVWLAGEGVRRSKVPGGDK